MSGDGPCETPSFRESRFDLQDHLYEWEEVSDSLVLETSTGFTLFMTILVVGSLCVDNTLYVSSLPSPGETVIAHSSLSSFGGKGANQALAAKMAGGEVTFLACTGNDPAGHGYRKHLDNHGIDSTSIVVDSKAPTGSAFLAVEDSGENSIVINPGANHALRPEHLDQHLDLFKKATHLLLQLEIPFETIQHACRLARENKVTILMNPSPWSDDFNPVDFPCDVLIVNEHEAASFLGPHHEEPSGELLEKVNLQTLLVTHGNEPTLVVSKSGEPYEVPPPAVTPVDTVGAGDAFTGALAVALAEGQSLKAAVRFANTAASLSILKPGAQGATPTRDEIELAVSGNERYLS